MSTLDDWLASVSAELGIDLDIDVRALLDLTREVAHSVERPAAPLTAFLVGYAAASTGGGRAAVSAATTQVLALTEARSGPR